MRKSWYPQEPVKSLFNQIQDCVDYAEAGVITISATQSSIPPTPRYLQLESSTVISAVGMTDFLQSRPGMRSKLTLQCPTASTSKYSGEQLLLPGTPTQLWHNLMMKILQEQPFIHVPTLPHPLQWTAAV
jgi:hypothetical protein